MIFISTYLCYSAFHYLPILPLFKVLIPFYSIHLHSTAFPPTVFALHYLSVSTPAFYCCSLVYFFHWFLSSCALTNFMLFPQTYTTFGITLISLLPEIS